MKSLNYIIKTGLVITLITILFVGCNQSNNDYVITKKNNFSRDITLNSVEKELDETIKIKEWIASDSILICLSPKSEKIVYLLRMPQLESITSAGLKGEGPNELIAPHIVGLDSDSIVLIDNGRKQLMKLWNDSIVARKKIILEGLTNRPRLSQNGDIFYLSSGESGTYIARIDNQQTTTKIVFNLSEIDDDISNLSYDVYDEYIVATSSGTDRVAIHNLSSGETVIMEGSADAEFNYSDVICLKDSFFLLSQHNINGETLEGTTVIEQYDYKGEPMSRYTLDFIAFSSVYDSNTNSFIMTSPMDDNLHIVAIAGE